jgi:hypothetical protein
MLEMYMNSLNSKTSGGERVSLDAWNNLVKNEAKPVCFSRRDRAASVREELDMKIADGFSVELNFEGVEATQSFIDELIGIVVLERGVEVLGKLTFRKCSSDMKAIINFVVSDRALQHAKSPHFFAPR